MLLIGMLPWTLLLPGFARHLIARVPAVREERSGALGFFLLAGLGCLAFFSASGCKRPCYILPAMPPSTSIAMIRDCSRKKSMHY